MEAGGLLHGDVLLEWYRYPPGAAVTLPGHAHAEYQLNLNLGGPAGVHYRGAYEVVPAGALGVLMPGEPHVPRDPAARDRDTAHLTLYVPVEAVVEAAGPGGTPSFADVVVSDPGLVRRFVAAHEALGGGAATDLEREGRLLALLAALAARAGRDAGPPPRAHRAVTRARAHLHEHLARNVSLTELAAVAGLSRHHLSRIFAAATGMPPHAYHRQLRVEAAKRLLLSGHGVSDAAHATGFFDLSHFSRQFRSHVGVAPGAYARRARDR